MKISNKFLLTGDGITQMACPKNKEKYENGLPDTIVIHYTAGRSAESSARYLSNDDVRASAHIVIGREGEIYQLVPFDTISWHAGESSYGNRTWLNKYSIGIELANAGVLTKVGNEYQAWFGKKYQADEVLQKVHRNETKMRYWHAYTEEQIEVCQQVCDLLIGKYNIKEILGHEEIAVGRKTDPGPAFPLDKLREQLLLQNRTDEPNLMEIDGEIKASSLNIRDGAGINFKKVALPLKRGTKVKIVEELNGWYRIKVNIEGWVSKGHVITE